MTRKDFIAAALASKTDSCIAWPYAVRMSSGYGAFGYNAGGSRINCDAHRFVCREAHGARIGMEAAHSCGNKLCVNPRHLRWATHAVNMKDAKRHGTLRGGGRYRQRFFPEDVAAIRASNDSYLTLANEYETDVSYIGRLRRVA